MKYEYYTIDKKEYIRKKKINPCYLFSGRMNEKLTGFELKPSAGEKFLHHGFES